MRKTRNIKSFLGSPGWSVLAEAYSKLVALELALKDHLGAPARSISHDLFRLLNLLANQGSAQNPPVSPARLNAHAQQLRNALVAMTCCDQGGLPCPVPSSSYPYMRYIRHELDGWPAPFTSETAVALVKTCASQLIAEARQNYGVQL